MLEPFKNEPDSDLNLQFSDVRFHSTHDNISRDYKLLTLEMELDSVNEKGSVFKVKNVREEN